MSEDHGYRILLHKLRGRPIGRLISRQTRSGVVHASFLCPNFDLLEATAPRCQRRVFNPETEINDVIPFIIKGWTIDQWKGAEEWWRDKIRRGVRYDYWNVLRWYARVKPYENNARLFCSEGIELCAESQGTELVARTKPELIAPQTLFESWKMIYSPLQL